MARPEQEPVEIPHHMGRDEKAWTHPAFGQIQVSRVSGRANLYGSDFPHNAYVVVRVYGSQLNRSLSRDWHFAREQYIEVAMSEAQWATFVSSFNAGMGTPCTLMYVGWEQIPGIPDRNETQEFEVEANDDLRNAVEALERHRQEILDNTKGVSKKAQEAMLAGVNTALKALTDSLPFVAKQFGEHVEKKVERAKVEVHAYMNQAVQAAGLQALIERGDIKPPLEIEGPKGGAE